MRSSSSQDYSFGSERRIKRRSDFLRIQGKGKKVSSRHFLLATSPQKNSAQTSFRLGLTVTTKVEKRATRRNLLKRRLKECFRSLRPRFIGETRDLVIIAKTGAADLKFEQLRREFLFLLHSAKLLPEKGKR